MYPSSHKLKNKGILPLCTQCFIFFLYIYFITDLDHCLACQCHCHPHPLATCYQNIQAEPVSPQSVFDIQPVSMILSLSPPKLFKVKFAAWNIWPHFSQSCTVHDWILLNTEQKLFQIQPGTAVHLNVYVWNSIIDLQGPMKRAISLQQLGGQQPACRLVALFWCGVITIK